MIKNVCWGKKRKKVKSCENTHSPWLEPDENWLVLYFLIWNEETTMEKWSVSNKRWKAAGSRALLSSEPVPASMMPICGWLKREVKWKAGEDWGGPASEGVRVRRILKLKHTCRYSRGQKHCKPCLAVHAWLEEARTGLQKILQIHIKDDKTDRHTDR